MDDTLLRAFLDLAKSQNFSLSARNLRRFSVFPEQENPQTGRSHRRSTLRTQHPWRDAELPWALHPGRRPETRS